MFTDAGLTEQQAKRLFDFQPGWFREYGSFFFEHLDALKKKKE